jgi:hypothetical protein
MFAVLFLAHPNCVCGSSSISSTRVSLLTESKKQRRLFFPSPAENPCGDPND